MKLHIQLDSSKLIYMFGSVLLAGSITSALLAKDLRWMSWHFSRLGEGGMPSAIIFNISVFISAILMYTLGHILSDKISQITDIKNIDLIRAKTIISRAFTGVAVCLIFVSIFPFDRFPVIHDIFGYSMLFIFLLLCLEIHKILPIFSKQFYFYGRFVILSTAICYVLFFGLKVITLLTVEFIIFSFLYAWLFMFSYEITKQSYI